jgi:hypothetical protein
MSTIISDLHIHCGLKGFASEGHPDYADYSIWDYYPAQEGSLQKLNFMLRAAIKETAKASQANLDACAAANLRVPFFSIYPIERQMFDLDPQKPFRSLFNLLLQGDQHICLGSAVTGFPLATVADIVRQVANEEGKGFNYYPEYLREVRYLQRQTLTQSKHYAEHRFRIASEYSDLQELLVHDKTIAGLLTVEGAHSFGHYLRRSTFKKEWEELDQEEEQVLRSSFLENIHHVKTDEGGKYAPLFVTFCHHFNNLWQVMPVVSPTNRN